MADVARLYVLDVGHGNCAIALGEGYSLMVDAAPSVAVIQAIEHLAIHRFDAILISHRDSDHARGLVTLLGREDLEIDQIFIGADAAKDPAAPDSALLLTALFEAKRGGRCRVSRDLDAALPDGRLSGGRMDVEILAPTFQAAMTGVGGRNAKGRTLTSNSMSAIVRVTLDSGLRVLLPGDADEATLIELTAIDADLTADILVFPHHGSLGGIKNERVFAQALTERVRPASVVFSVGRGRIARPSEEIVRGVFDAAPNVHIACTQLSSGCRGMNRPLDSAAGRKAHLSTIPAAGAERCRSCAGSIEFVREGMSEPHREAHQEYLEGVADTPMCRTLRPT